jgi:Na+/H+-dicarboxylate symporter
MNSLKDLYIHLQTLVKNRLWLKVLIGLFLGIILGIILSPNNDYMTLKTSETITNWLALPGNLFIRLVQMIMIPLIISSIIQGIAGGDNKDTLKEMGPKLGLYFLLTTLFSIIIGLALVLIIEPGNYISNENLLVKENNIIIENNGNNKINIPEVISNVLPINPLQSMISGDMLSLIVFSIIVAIALNSMNKKTAEPLMEIIFSIQEICMTVTKWAMKLAPYAVFGLICQVTAKVGINALAGLSMYIVTVLLGLFLLMVFYMAIIYFNSNYGLKYFIVNMKDLLLLAFSVASTAAVMPLSLKTVEEKLHVSPSLSKFIIPVGATINMNGTALYQAIATIFLSQVYHLDLSLMSIILIVITTVGASIGTPSSPGAGIIILATVLSSVGIPIEGIALIIGVDHILGMCRTAVNVTGDVTACVYFQNKADQKNKKLV